MKLPLFCFCSKMAGISRFLHFNSAESHDVTILINDNSMDNDFLNYNASDINGDLLHVDYLTNNSSAQFKWFVKKVFIVHIATPRHTTHKIFPSLFQDHWIRFNYRVEQYFTPQVSPIILAALLSLVFICWSSPDRKQFPLAKQLENFPVVSWNNC